MLHEVIYPREVCPFLPPCETEVTLTSYARPRSAAPSDTGDRWAILLLPGGAYFVHGDKEGEASALSFLADGFQAFVLNYPINPDHHPLPLLYTAWAVSWLRDNKEKYGIDRVAVCGFSAGGHLAGSMANLWHLPLLSETMGKPAEAFRPDAAILSYPVINYSPDNASFRFLLGRDATEEEAALLSLEKSVTKGNPPTFLWATVTDDRVPVSNSMSYAQALLEAGVSLEFHLYPKGPHAMACATKETAYYPESIDDHVATWTKLCAQWLNTL